MALPDYPETRGEAYLNAIATGNTSGLPAYPETKVEAYLDAIARGGGGGGGGSSGGGVLVVRENIQTGALDKTWQEIYDADFVVIRMDFSEAEHSYAYIQCVS